MFSSLLTRTLLLLFCLLTPALATADPAAEEARLLSLLDEFLAGASVSDASMHDRFWASDLIYTSSSGARYGKAEIMLGLTAGPDEEVPDTSGEELPAPRYWAEEQQVMVMEDTAVVAFRLVGETPQKGGLEPVVQYYFNTGTFRLRDGVWQAVAWQATRIPEAAADPVR